MRFCEDEAASECNDSLSQLSTLNRVSKVLLHFFFIFEFVLKVKVADVEGVGLWYR